MDQEDGDGVSCPRSVPDVVEISLAHEAVATDDLSTPGISDPVIVNLADAEPLCEPDLLMPTRIADRAES
jgi:hypothetical protein